MIVQTTAAGQALFNATPLSVIITSCVLGNGVNYLPATEPVGLSGSTVHTVLSSISPEAASNNSVKYTVILPNNVGNFNFGEVAFYVGATLVAVGVLSALINKVADDEGVQGNKVKLEAYIDLGSNVRFTGGDVTLSNSKDLIPRIPNVDLLPQINATTQSLVSVYSDESVQPFICHSDGVGRWAIETKSVVYQTGVVSITGPFGISSTISGTEYSGDAEDLVIQFTTGVGRSICRRIVSKTAGDIQWSTPIATNQPEVGDAYIILGPIQASAGGPVPSVNEPIDVITKPLEYYQAALNEGYSYIRFTSPAVSGFVEYQLMPFNYSSFPSGWWQNLSNSTTLPLLVSGGITVNVKPGFERQISPGGTATLIAISPNVFDLFGDLVPSGN